MKKIIPLALILFLLAACSQSFEGEMMVGHLEDWDSAFSVSAPESFEYEGSMEHFISFWHYDDESGVKDGHVCVTKVSINSLEDFRMYVDDYIAPMPAEPDMHYELADQSDSLMHYTWWNGPFKIHHYFLYCEVDSQAFVVDAYHRYMTEDVLRSVARSIQLHE